jgi:hypothetical protein
MNQKIFTITKPSSAKKTQAIFANLISICLLAGTAIASMDCSSKGFPAETCEHIWWTGAISSCLISFLFTSAYQEETITITADAAATDELAKEIAKKLTSNEG